MFACLDFAVQMLPSDRPRYLMGVGKPDDMSARYSGGSTCSIACSPPVPAGRARRSPPGPLNIRNARFAEDTDPIEPDCPCPACTHFERAYVHHLVKSGEILGAMLMTQHNLWFYQR